MESRCGVCGDRAKGGVRGERRVHVTLKAMAGILLFCIHRTKHTQNWRSLNKMSEFYQYRFLSCDSTIILQDLEKSRQRAQKIFLY